MPEGPGRPPGALNLGSQDHENTAEESTSSRHPDRLIHGGSLRSFGSERRCGSGPPAVREEEDERQSTK